MQADDFQKTRLLHSMEKGPLLLLFAKVAYTYSMNFHFCFEPISLNTIQ